MHSQVCNFCISIFLFLNLQNLIFKLINNYVHRVVNMTEVGESRRNACKVIKSFNLLRQIGSREN